VSKNLADGIEREAVVTREETMSQLIDLNNAFADPFENGEVIYHYTSGEAFRGIVASGEIWLTNTAFVNDTTECKAFWDLPKQEVFGTDPFPNGDVVKRWELKKEIPNEYNCYYIASFSRIGNLLPQYRAYGSFCVGFRASELVKAKFNLYRCVYSLSEITEWIREKSTVKQWSGTCLGDLEKGAGAHGLLHVASMKYKSKHYEGEEEVRLVAVSTHDLRRWPRSFQAAEDEPAIHFRDRPMYEVPIPYVKFFVSAGRTNEGAPIGEDPQPETASQMRQRRLKEEDAMPRELLPITKVWIGPMARQAETRLACEIMLLDKGYENVEVECSKIPYRGP
jgi:hypothetical protein